MRTRLPFEQIFPIRDPASARLSRCKADCMLSAGVIDRDDWVKVYARSAALLGYAGLDRVRPQLAQRRSADLPVAG